MAAEANVAEKHVIQVVVSGFLPFGKRTENTSKVVASEVLKDNANTDINIQEVIMPVRWGYPMQAINKVLAKGTPIDLWLALGEDGVRNGFYVETVAHNSAGWLRAIRP